MLDPQRVRAQVVEILTSPEGMSLQLDVDRLDETTSLSNDLALDSIQKLELGIALEEAFRLNVDAKLFDTSLDRFGALVEYLAQNAITSTSTAEQA